MRKKTIFYLCMELCFILLFLFVRHQKKMAERRIEFNDSTNLQEGTFILYDSELQEIGTLELKKLIIILFVILMEAK